MRIESVRDLHRQFPDIDGYWGSSDLTTTEALIRAQLPLDPEASWSPTALVASLHLVRVLNLQGKPMEAKAVLELARKQIANSSPPIKMIEIRLLLEEGRHLCINMTPVKAQPFFNSAWTLASDGEDFLAIEAAVMLSISQPPKAQNQWLQKAIRLAENSKVEATKLWLAQLYLMDGWNSFDFRRMEEALKSFYLALARPRVVGEMTDLILIKWCVARALRALGRTEEALALQLQLREELNGAGRVNGHVFLELAECYQLLQQKDEAKTYFEAAYKELSSDGWYSDNKGSELSRMQELYKKRY